MTDLITENVTLLHGDCLERMNEMQDGSVDVIFTDPPYKVTSRGGYTSAGGMMLDDKMRKGKVFKENSIDIESWLPDLYRVLKDTGHCYIMTNNKNITKYLQAVDKSDFHLIKTLIWVKDNKIMSQAYMSQFEFVLFLRKGAFKKINNCGTSDVLRFNNPKNKNHPTEKPVDLIETLINSSSSELDIVFDPFSGGGSTGVAAINTNRKFIGIELDDNYYQVGKNRIVSTIANIKTESQKVAA